MERERETCDLGSAKNSYNNQSLLSLLMNNEQHTQKKERKTEEEKKKKKKKKRERERERERERDTHTHLSLINI